jgi:hypothetical protein
MTYFDHGIKIRRVEGLKRYIFYIFSNICLIGSWLVTQVPYERPNIHEYEYHSEMVPLQLKPYETTKELKDANDCHSANHSMFSPILFSES